MTTNPNFSRPIITIQRLAVTLCVLAGLLSSCASRNEGTFAPPEPPPEVAPFEARHEPSLVDTDFFNSPWEKLPTALSAPQNNVAPALESGFHLAGDFARHLQIILMGALSYFFLILFLRVSGKRTLSKMNAFDLVITVALGSTLGAAMTQSALSLSEVALALSLLVCLQFLVTFFAARSTKFSALVKSDPTVLFYHGRFLGKELRDQRVTADKVLAAAREQGYGSMAEVSAVVLESNGQLTALGAKGDSALQTILPKRFASKRTSRSLDELTLPGPA